MRGAFPTGWRPGSLARSGPPAFAGREDPPRTPPRRRVAPRRRARDFSTTSYGILLFGIAWGPYRRRGRLLRWLVLATVLNALVILLRAPLLGVGWGLLAGIGPLASSRSR